MSFLKIFLIFAAGMSFTYFMMNREDAPDLTKLELKPAFIEQADIPKDMDSAKKQVSKVFRTQAELAKEGADNFTAIYNRLGLKAGDVIKKVNDISVVKASHKIFPALVNGFKSGNVCVTFQRNGEDRQSCLRTVTNEDVVNQPVTSN